MDDLTRKVLSSKRKNKVRKIIKWTIVLKLSIATAATGYMLSKYKPYDVTIEGDVHYHASDEMQQDQLETDMLASLDSELKPMIEVTPSGFSFSHFLQDAQTGFLDDYDRLKITFGTWIDTAGDYFRGLDPFNRPEE